MRFLCRVELLKTGSWIQRFPGSGGPAVRRDASLTQEGRPVHLSLTCSLSVVPGLHEAVWDVQQFISAYFCEAGGSICITAGADWLGRRCGCYKCKWETRTRSRDTQKLWVVELQRGTTATVFALRFSLIWRFILHYFTHSWLLPERAGVSHPARFDNDCQYFIRVPL